MQHNDGERETHTAGSFFSNMDNPLTNRAIEIVGSANAGGTFASTDGFHIALLYEVMDDPN
jgi:hypothetical protein